MSEMIEIELRDQPVYIVDVSIGRAEPDVGITTSYIDGYKLQDAEGRELDWYDSLTPIEEAAIDRAIFDSLPKDEP